MIFNETISISGTRPNGTLRGSVKACLVDNGLPSGFDELSTATNRREVMVFVRSSDWSLVSRSLPQVGDRITDAKRRTFAVRSVNELGGDIFSLGAAQC